MPESLCLKDLIQVQPMNVPFEHTFYMDFVKAGPTRWQRFKKRVMDWTSTIWFFLTGQV